MAAQRHFADPSPWRRPWFVIAAVLLALVVLLGVAVALWPSADDDAGPSRPLPTGAPGDPSPAAPSTGAAILPTAVPTRPPADVTWQLVGPNSVPVSKSAGPRTVEGGAASGFAHTPEGALVAVAQLAARAGLSMGRDSWEPTIEKGFVPGADRDKLLATLRAAPEQQAEPGDLSPLAGYVFQAYTPDTAVIGLVYRSPAAGSGTGQYHVVTTTMQWQSEDWKMVAPPGGSWLSVSRPAADLTGVVAWGAR